ncbi:MAG: hypothetical protein GKR94_33130 [Gammaproteobacteria bacterium]|nr:hypothetical protein [Gammaproteobacteria bacterium]
MWAYAYKQTSLKTARRRLTVYGQPIERQRMFVVQRRQRGIVLMSMLLVVTLGAAAVTLHELNQRARSGAGRDLETVRKSNAALVQAREALLGAAIGDVAVYAGSPLRPGQLPWPDRAQDRIYDGKSDCVTNNFRSYHLLGRFPYLGEISCHFGGRHSSVVTLDTLYRDGSGEPLWYAVSRNLVNQGQPHLSINPDLVDNPLYPWMRVCDSRGRLVAGRVAAVIIAPGPALAHQSRSGRTPDAGQYLERISVRDARGLQSWLSNDEYNNAPDDSNGMRGPDECRQLSGGHEAIGEEFVIPVGGDSAQAALINDQLVYVTADELVDGVQRRAMSVVARALEAYRDGAVAGGGIRGRLPWMSPFANAWEGRSNPDTDTTTLMLEGQADGGGTAALHDDDRVFGPHLVGAAIRNLTTGASGVILGVSEPPDGNLLTSVLLGGMDVNSGTSPRDRFSAGDTYQIATFRGDAKRMTREGQLAFHHPDQAEDRAANFSVAWDFAVTGALAPPALSVILAPSSPAPNYPSNLLEFVRRSRLVGEVTVDEGGVCRVDGVGTGLVRCQGRMVRSPYLAARIEQTAGNDVTLTRVANALDTAAQPFTLAQWGIERGDRIRNLTDGSQGIVAALDPLTGKALRVVALSGGTGNRLSLGDEVSVEPAAQAFTGTATGGSRTTLQDVSRPLDFLALGVTAGDVLVNTTDGSYAFISAATATELAFSALVGGAEGEFQVGDHYEIRSDFIVQRRITFDLYYSGVESKQASALNLRTITAGSPTAAARLGGLPVLPAAALASNRPLQYAPYAVRVDDLDRGGAVVGSAVADVNNGGAGADVYLSTRDIERDFVIGDDIPEWFYDNGWYEFIYVAVGSGFSPAGTGNCSGGGCIDVFNRRRSRRAEAHLSYINTVQAVVVGAGSSVSSSEIRPAGQVRPSADVADYFEEENAQVSSAHQVLGGFGDGEFEVAPTGIPLTTLRRESVFNDQVVSICANRDCRN